MSSPETRSEVRLGLFFQMKAKGAIRGKHARAYEKRAVTRNWTHSVKHNLIPELKPKKSMKIVDFCTGSGNIIPFFKNRVKEFTAVDASKEMTKIIKERYGDMKNLKIIKSDVAETPLKSGKYDAVIIKFSLHHVYHAEPMIKEAYRLLKKNGRFFIIDCVLKDKCSCKARVPFVKIKKIIKNGFQELFCKYRTDRQIMDLISKSKFRFIQKKRVNLFLVQKCFYDMMYVLKKV
jgi:ubiquinone/menaquinone biosynthesis C-methylase UbiE